jgi:hypothetical protein
VSLTPGGEMGEGNVVARHGELTSRRVTSVLSLIGTSFIIATFLISTDYHKPINRLVFYASFGNIITNVATLVSTSSIHAGATSPLCQLQAFLIQMCVLWTLPRHTA